MSGLTAGETSSVLPSRLTRSAVALVLVLGGCRSAAPVGTGTSPLAPEAAQATDAFLMGVYAGTLPCADCRGIRTTVTMYAKNRWGTGGGTFNLSEEYLGTRHGNRRVDTRGRWIVLRGTPTDADATVYQLNVDDAKRILYLLRVSDQALLELDREQRAIRSPANHTLARLTEPPPGDYDAIDPVDADVSLTPWAPWRGREPLSDFSTNRVRGE
jgi:uncharacterized lipoprotein NlpE involved in copper resistance